MLTFHQYNVIQINAKYSLFVISDANLRVVRCRIYRACDDRVRCIDTRVVVQGSATEKMVLAEMQTPAYLAMVEFKYSLGIR